MWSQHWFMWSPLLSLEEGQFMFTSAELLFNYRGFRNALITVLRTVYIITHIRRCIHLWLEDKQKTPLPISVFIINRNSYLAEANSSVVYQAILEVDIKNNAICLVITFLQISWLSNHRKSDIAWCITHRTQLSFARIPSVVFYSINCFDENFTFIIKHINMCLG